VAEFAGAALAATYYVALLIKAQPAEHAGYSGLGALLVVLLLAVLAAAGAATLHLRWMALAAVRWRAMVEMRSRGAGAQAHSTVINPAWGEEAEESAGARVAELETELQAVKREHSKAQAAHDAELEEAATALQAERERSAVMMAELAQLKKDE
jgi:cytochrome b